MRILVISNTPPRADNNTMGIQQTYHRLRKLAAHHEFIVAYTNQGQNAEPQTSDAVPFQLVRLPNPARRAVIPFESRPRVYWQIRGWQQALVERTPQIYRDHHDPALGQSISQLAQKHSPDVIHVIGEGMLMSTPSDCPRLLADLPDLFSILFGRLNHPAPRRSHQWQHAREIQKMQRVERDLLQRATAALFVSETDRAAAQKLAPHAHTDVVPNSVDLDFFSAHSEPEPNLVLFTGTLSYAPNIQALEFFVNNIWPRIRETVPDAQLEIVGYNPPPAILAIANPSIRVHANVPDIRPYLERAAVCIAPILSGSGTRIKIIEAWAMQRAVVSTRLGAEGLEARTGTHLLLADAPEEFAQAVIAILTHPAQRHALGKAGYQLAAEKYSMARAAERLNIIYETIATGKLNP